MCGTTSQTGPSIPASTGSKKHMIRQQPCFCQLRVCPPIDMCPSPASSHLAGCHEPLFCLRSVCARICFCPSSFWACYPFGGVQASPAGRVSLHSVEAGHSLPPQPVLPGRVDPVSASSHRPKSACCQGLCASWEKAQLVGCHWEQISFPVRPH